MQGFLQILLTSHLKWSIRPSSCFYGFDRVSSSVREFRGCFTPKNLAERKIHSRFQTCDHDSANGFFRPRGLTIERTPSSSTALSKCQEFSKIDSAHAKGIFSQPGLPACLQILNALCPVTHSLTIAPRNEERRDKRGFPVSESRRRIQP
jgi:hypothetical protein